MKTLTEVVMPQLAESLVSAYLLRNGSRSQGNRLICTEPLCEIITDKSERRASFYPEGENDGS